MKLYDTQTIKVADELSFLFFSSAQCSVEVPVISLQDDRLRWRLTFDLLQKLKNVKKKSWVIKIIRINKLMDCFYFTRDTDTSKAGTIRQIPLFTFGIFTFDY